MLQMFTNMKSAEEMFILNIIEIPAKVLFAKSHRAKRLSITIKPFKPVRITIPKRISYKTAREFFYANLEWVKKSVLKIKEIEQQEKNEVVNVPAIDRNKARINLIERLDYLSQKFDFHYNRVTIRNQKTRWGSCSHHNNISLNVNLVRLPQQLQDYVILHELVHTRIKNHSKRFWLEVEKYITSPKVIDKLLRNYDLTRFHSAA